MSKRPVISNFPLLDSIPDTAKLFRKIDSMPALIDGELIHWQGPMQDVTSAIRVDDGGVIKAYSMGKYPLMTAKEAEAALSGAVKAYDRGLGEWPSMKSEDRVRAVENFLGRMQEKREEVVRLLMWEIGKTRADSEKEFDRTVQYVRDSIDELRKVDAEGAELHSSDGILTKTGRRARGVVLCMGPFNYPLNETFTTLMPALLMGNTVVFKPPKVGVLLFDPLMQAFRDSFPPGVVNTVYGDGREVITPIMKSGQVDVLAFIGSTKVADAIEHLHPKPHRMKAVLGLGAKNPAVILPDADIDSILPDVLAGTLSYNGQRCTALKQIFVHESRAQEFVDKFSDAVSKLKVGMPWEPGVKITPLPEENKSQQMAEYVEDAVSHGARVVNQNGGNYQESLYTPAVVYPVTKEMRLFHEEQFGPVVPIATYKDPEEVVRWVANSEYRQQASVFGRDLNVISPLVEKLSRVTCRVNINAQCQRGPDNVAFTGGPGSAMGTLSLRDALIEFSIEDVRAGKEGQSTRDYLSSLGQ